MKRAAATFVLLAVFGTAVHAAEPLGRLFFTPAQRNTLDAGKQLDRPKTVGPTVQGPRSLTVNGIVTRSDGESTVWVNGRQANAARPGAAPIHAKPSGSTGAKVRVLESESKLRVGQTLDRRTGKITELYERKPAAAEIPATAKNGSVPADAAASVPSSDPGGNPKENAAAN